MLSLLPLYIDARFIDSRYEEARFMVAKLLAKIEATIDGQRAFGSSVRSTEALLYFLVSLGGQSAAKKVARDLVTDFI